MKTCIKDFLFVLIKTTLINLLSLFILFLGWIFVYAITFPSSNPAWEVSWWKFSAILNWILQTWDYSNPWIYKVKYTKVSDNWQKLVWNNNLCNSWQILQWFDTNGNKICITY